MTRAEELTAIAKIIRRIVKEKTGGKARWRGAQHDTGWTVVVHRNDGSYDMTANFEGKAWLDYVVLDEIADAIELAGIYADVDYLSDYELGVTL